MNDLMIRDWLKVSPELMCEVLGKKFERNPDLFHNAMKRLNEILQESRELEMAMAQDSDFVKKWYKAHYGEEL